MWQSRRCVHAESAAVKADFVSTHGAQAAMHDQIVVGSASGTLSNVVSHAALHEHGMLVFINLTLLCRLGKMTEPRFSRLAGEAALAESHGQYRCCTCRHGYPEAVLRTQVVDDPTRNE
jgi:hypothetical protein